MRPSPLAGAVEGVANGAASWEVKEAACTDDQPALVIAGKEHGLAAQEVPGKGLLVVRWKLLGDYEIYFFITRHKNHIDYSMTQILDFKETAKPSYLLIHCSNSRIRERIGKDEEMLLTGSLKSLLPHALRRIIRCNRLSISNTSGMAEGYKQANIVILHKSLADDFEKFCLANDGPLPLLYRSQPGEWKCPSLSSDSDIRTDCLQYRKYEYGACTGSLKSLKEYSEQLKDMVTFYLGCSFSFEKAVQKSGIPIRNVEQKCNVSMYKTSVPCYSISMFHCNLVVTMRPIPESKLGAAVLATSELKEAHGAPIHIGDPGLLGIQDLSKPDYGDPVRLHSGDIPVFWACGVTGVEAIINCRAPLAFTHSPGCMFITDVKNDNVTSSGGVPQVHCISQDPLHFSIVSEAAAQKIKALETLIGIDPVNIRVWPKSLIVDNGISDLDDCMLPKYTEADWRVHRE
ncbi:hypothetical protein TURU_159968 [Turdus rufiventris]|nr:hypothetical protein TURU_159968 [Turdus rufiventris]